MHFLPLTLFPFPLVLLLGTTRKGLGLHVHSQPSGVYIHWEDPSKPCPGWKVPAPSAFFHVSDASSSSWPFALHVSHVLESPALDTAFQTCLQCWAEKKDHLPQSTGNVLPDAAQEAVWLLLQGPIVGSWSAWRPQWAPGPLQSCFPAAWPHECICQHLTHEKFYTVCPGHQCSTVSAHDEHCPGDTLVPHSLCHPTSFVKDTLHSRNCPRWAKQWLLMADLVQTR